MTNFVTYATNHSRPWMDLVEDHGLSEDEAKKVFDRFEPLKSEEERRVMFLELAKEARDAVRRRHDRTQSGH